MSKDFLHSDCWGQDLPLLPVEHCQAQLFINMCKPEFQFYINLKYVLHFGMLFVYSFCYADKQGIFLKCFNMCKILTFTFRKSKVTFLLHDTIIEVNTFQLCKKIWVVLQHNGWFCISLIRKMVLENYIVLFYICFIFINLVSQIFFC